MDDNKILEDYINMTADDNKKKEVCRFWHDKFDISASDKFKEVIDLINMKEFTLESLGDKVDISCDNNNDLNLSYIREEPHRTITVEFFIKNRQYIDFSVNPIEVDTHGVDLAIEINNKLDIDIEFESGAYINSKNI